jgi:predicted phage tail protein
MINIRRYLALSSLAAGIFCLILGAALVVKAFFVDALSSWGYGVYGLMILAIGVLLTLGGKNTLKSSDN